jgi:DNA mismatch repair protein MutS
MPVYGDRDIAPFLRTLSAVQPITRDVFDGATAERRLSGYFGVASTDAFGA